MSIEGLVVSLAFFLVLYLPVLKKRSSTSFSFEASTSFLIGRPMHLATWPA